MLKKENLCAVNSMPSQSHFLTNPVIHGDCISGDKVKGYLLAVFLTTLASRCHEPIELDGVEVVSTYEWLMDVFAHWHVVRPPGSLWLGFGPVNFRVP